ncbi:MAG: glycosyltransferase [Nostoc sp. NMS1]|uniref:glycosyltransferase n=1 Tax=Nostoc sp. NMS1 TaxID=2815388 RepID=UPI0025FE8668|nr:glycosyltransferase [Nostoc sp. NMS1]MBN3906212.1 glycosyltransferase [Nostoc sp. NMS1]
MYNNYILNIESQIAEYMKSGDLESPLDLLVNFVEKIIRDNRATAKVFGSATLDKLCQQIGAKALEHQKPLLTIDSYSNHENGNIIYIATELYKTGGHTAVLEDLIKAQPHRKHIILITDIFNTVNREIILSRFASLNVQIEWAPQSTLLDKLFWLQSQLIERQLSQVFLFNHWQDAVAIAAVQPHLAQELIFYHHCDHQLCLGLYLSHAKHIDPHAFGFYNCRHNLGVANTRYIPLIVEDLGTRSPELPFIANGKLRTCSSGSGNKFEQIYPYSYIEEVPRILDVTQGVHIHIGELSHYSLERIRQGLEQRGITQESFIYIPWVKSLWWTISEQKIDVYLNSFPLGGGRASIEVMGSGTPFIGHQNYNSRVLSGIDIVYPEAYFWQKPEELYSYLQALTPEILAEQAAYSRRHYELYHTPKVLQQCLQDFNSEEGLFPLPLRDYVTDGLQNFLDSAHSDLTKQFIDIVDAMYPIWDTDKLELDKSKISEFLYRLTIPQYEKANLMSKLEHAQIEVENLKVAMLSKLQQTQAEVEQLKVAMLSQLQQPQLQQTQAEVEQLKATMLSLQQTQIEVEQLKATMLSKLQQTQIEVEQLKATMSSLQQTQPDVDYLKATMFSLQQIQPDIEYLKATMLSKLQQSQAEVEYLKATIAAIQTSKFWTIRTQWFKLKNFLGFVKDPGIVVNLINPTVSSTAYQVKILQAPQSNRPRIVHAIANFMTGGSSRLVIDLIEHLGHIYEQEVITSYIPNPPSYTGLNIHSLTVEQDILSYLNQFRPEIVHIHFWGDCDTTWYEKVFNAVQKYNNCIVVENINTPVKPYLSKNCHKYVYVSNYVKKTFGLDHPQHLTIYPGSNLDMFSRDNQRSIPEDCIGMVYRLEADKLNEKSIDVFIKVAQQRPKTKILIVGGGLFLEVYKEAVKKAKIADNFTFTGYVAYEKLPSFYEQMSIFVGPVWQESFGQVSPFAMNMGIPVVGYNIGGIAEIINNNELLAPPGDSSKLAEIIIDLLENREKRIQIGSANRQRAQALFSVQAMIRSYSSLYSELFQENL